MRKLTRAFAPIVFVLSLLFSGCALPMPSSSMVSMDELPAYSDSAYVEIDGNQPSFTDADKQETEAFEEYSDLDYLGPVSYTHLDVYKRQANACAGAAHRNARRCALAGTHGLRQAGDWI